MRAERIPQSKHGYAPLRTHFDRLSRWLQISAETFLREIKRRGLLSESLDIESELETVEAEGPPLASLSFPLEEPDEDEDEAEEDEEVEV